MPFGGTQLIAGSRGMRRICYKDSSRNASGMNGADINTSLISWRSPFGWLSIRTRTLCLNQDTESVFLRDSLQGRHSNLLDHRGPVSPTNQSSWNGDSVSDQSEDLGAGHSRPTRLPWRALDLARRTQVIRSHELFEFRQLVELNG